MRFICYLILSSYEESRFHTRPSSAKEKAPPLPPPEKVRSFSALTEPRLAQYATTSLQSSIAHRPARGVLILPRETQSGGCSRTTRASANAGSGMAETAPAPTDDRRASVLADYRKVLLQHKEADAKVRNSELPCSEPMAACASTTLFPFSLAVRTEVKVVKKEYDKTEDDLKALQSVGQIIGEVLRQLDEERCALPRQHTS